MGPAALNAHVCVPAALTASRLPAIVPTKTSPADDTVGELAIAAPAWKVHTGSRTAPAGSISSARSVVARSAAIVFQKKRKITVMKFLCYSGRRSHAGSESRAYASNRIKAYMLNRWCSEKLGRSQINQRADFPGRRRGT